MFKIRYRKLELNSRKRKEVLRLVFDFDKLRGRIKEKLKYEAVFAEKLNISQASLSSKFNNKSDFTSTEISRACDEDVLDISEQEIGEYFFRQKLELNSRTNATRYKEIRTSNMNRHLKRWLQSGS